MKLEVYYDAAIAEGVIHDDPLQRQMLSHLQRVLDNLTPSKKTWFRRSPKKTVQGIYLYGPVGGGKSYLMDLFYEHLQESKSRFHFHHFMQQMDAQLRRCQGQQDPLRRIAVNFAKSVRVLCLDEFMVYDIADAMILAELLRTFVAQGVVLIMTSNTRPDDLYLNGLQRARFLPVIELIKTHCEILVLADHRDYRLGRTSLVQAYQYPLDAATRRSLEEQFNALATETTQEELWIQQRCIPYVKRSGRAVWFTFDVMCNIPRSALDYLEIAERFDTVFLSDVPVIPAHDTVRALLLIRFIDVMYDEGIRLVISAEVPPEELYVAGAKEQEFQRTLSRLKEMQSVDYLGRVARSAVSAEKS